MTVLAAGELWSKSCDTYLKYYVSHCLLTDVRMDRQTIILKVILTDT